MTAQDISPGSNALDPDPKVASILQAAWSGFASYGFRKTSMDDIARGAGMSRPALYLHFKNKEAIFRALVALYYQGAEAEIRAALQTDVPLEAKLARAFAAHGGDSMEEMMSSAHGMELFEATMSVAGDMIEAGEGVLRGLYLAWLQREAAQGALHLSGEPEEMARLFCACLKGVKHTSKDFAEYSAGVAGYARLCAMALTP